MTMEKKNCYVIVDDATTAHATCDWDVLDTQDHDEAVKQTKAAWDRLSDFDKKKRDAFYLAFGEVDEDGCLGDHDIVFRIK